LELLITLAVLIILVTLWHGFSSGSNQQRQLKACQKNLQMIYLALEIFANEHHGRFPVFAGATTSEEPLDVLVPRYISASENFICPGSKDSPLRRGEPLVKQKISYAYFMGLRRPDATETAGVDPTSGGSSADVLMADRLVDTAPKNVGAPLFSKSGDAPGNNHHRYGGNILLTDGQQKAMPVVAPAPMLWPKDVVLLNPKP
jgi:type II secretory pathway pseudopilin PulG